MNQPIFTYNQQQAVDGCGSGSQYITESCVVNGAIESAKWISSSNNAKGLEISFVSDTGQKANYLTLYYQKKDSTINEVGHNQIQSLMGVTGCKQLSSSQNGQDWIAPELNKKHVRLALERENYTKGDGSEGFRFQIKAIMSTKSGLTVAEHIAGEPGKTSEYWVQRFIENPHGQQAKQKAQANLSKAQQQATPGGNFDDFDDDIPF